MSDEEILKSSYKRPSHFGELFDRHYGRFILIAQRALRSKDDAEDVVQETFVRIYKYGKKFPDNGGKFTPWANVVLRNCIADQIKKYKNVSVTLSEEMENSIPSQGPNPEEISISNNEQNKIELALKDMDGTAAEIINLRYILGKSFKEIAKILRIKSSTARVRFYRSKKEFVQTYKQFNHYE